MAQPSDPPPRRAREKAWHEHITLDLISHILSHTLFAPHIAWLIPLCLRAIGTQYHAPRFIASCVWAGFLSILMLANVVNRRVAYGPPRQLDWADEVVVITGGAGGLGRVLSQIYAMRGASVAVLDLRVPGRTKDRKDKSAGTSGRENENEAVQGVEYYECDVSDPLAIKRVRDQIERDLGPPTILINNAAILLGDSFLSIPTSSLSRSISVNLLGPMHSTRTFLPLMLSDITSGKTAGATVVNISSVLGKLGAARLSDYTAAKAGVIAFHRSLVAELTSPSAPAGSDHVRCVLVTPGQIDTSMFMGVKTPSSFFGPIIEPVDLAREIVKQIDSGMSGEISLPLYARWIEWMGVLPVGLQILVRRLAGVDMAMDGLKGARDWDREDEKKAGNKTS